MQSNANADEAIARLATTARIVAVIGLRMVSPPSRRSLVSLVTVVPSTVRADAEPVVALAAESGSLSRVSFRRGGSLSRLMELGTPMP
jgi:hypothetical protein